ncbi:hypothetical protein DBR37_12930 [Herminiimonas sp. KBW02]|nr:hypothetical protein DBR37_12930 [Herminiimonas sp. KBW02]
MRTSIVGQMLGRLARIIVVSNTIFAVVVIDAVQMLDFMLDIESMVDLRRCALQSKTLQRKQHQQENTDKATHDYTMRLMR